jgi:hypothetical protein
MASAAFTGLAGSHPIIVIKQAAMQAEKRL